TESLPEDRLAAKRSSSHQSFGGLRKNGVNHREKVS
ncbi:MAG: HU family DNA-binding protein, partial [Dietzia sp.]|nr:HU family DNA-binding protein [Dietzia sp.]